MSEQAVVEPAGEIEKVDAPVVDAPSEAEAAAKVKNEEAVFGKAPEGAEAEIKAKADADAAKAEADKTDADAKGDWPEDWREKLAGGDEKLLARLRRFGSPAGVWRSFAELEKKVSSGGLKKSLSDAPSAEELAAYRKENGIPDAPEGYELKVPDGLDKSVKSGMDAFAKHMHAINAPPAVVKAAADLYLQAEEKAEQERFDFAQKQTIENKATLKAEFGREYDAEVRRANSLLVSTLGESAKDFMATTLSDGTKLGDNPAFVRFAAQVSRVLADDGALIAEDGGSKGASLKDEYDGLMALMTTDSKKYYSEPTQKRLTELSNKLETRGWK
jgi:hypothetical protein